MSKHYIRDLQIVSSSTQHTQAQINYVLFHFLRNAGWTWLWECDGYAGVSPNRIPDGNMELAGVANWAAIGTGTRSKVTSPVYSGIQSLEVVSLASGDGVESAIFTSMENSTQYHLAIRARNNTGQPWTVWFDNGGGSYVAVGSIAHGGTSFTLTHIDVTTGLAGNRKIKITDGAGTLGTIHISDILVVKSYWDYNPSDTVPKGTDGSTVNPNQFSSLSYSFVAGDIGKVICIWDPTNPKNSGAYKITAAAGGVATVDMRSGTATFIAQSGLTWRMINPLAGPVAQANTGHKNAGFGLQSPHSSGWRIFIRQNLYNVAQSAIAVWGAPSTTDFDFSTGNFYKTGPSTQHEKQAANSLWSSGSGTYASQHFWSFSTNASYGTNRYFLMTDDTCSFLAQVMWDVVGGTNHDCPVIGYLGSSPYMPGEEAWGLFASWETWAASSRMNWSGGASQFAYNGTMIGPIGLTEDAVWGQYGFGNSTADVVTQSNAGDNPWSANEWLHKPIAVRDPEGAAGHPAEMTIDIGVLQGRQNMTHLSTYDGNTLLHFDNGLVWEWNGEATVP